MAWQVETLDPAFVERARREGVDALGQPVCRRAAAGGEPFRDALRRARPGEALILASYSPFRQAGPYREYGPVFLAVEPQPAALPGLSALLGRAGEDAYLGEGVALRAYDSGQAMLEAVLLPTREAEAMLARWAARPEIAFAMLRFPAHGCYALRLNRSQ
ncbi:hypothetical protein B0T37_00440 [Chromobacterium violaceum]|uniref:DUF1203 domain-containing protein n=1 Tax=Chromobacterium violaceum TaxID=536 RepID=UPI0009D9F375|nr:DUF1203 domain-containing protein [Chromobacterium violaceum]OQS10453.1 hypothetical protein B0T38_10075 [Chromobacterium violaceum]OQS29861.1 hypothetical protein B0T37_00440 [Chromobacterium violaceum]